MAQYYAETQTSTLTLFNSSLHEHVLVQCICYNRCSVYQYFVLLVFGTIYNNFTHASSCKARSRITFMNAQKTSCKQHNRKCNKLINRLRRHLDALTTCGVIN